jgi:hypothetical protein
MKKIYCKKCKREIEPLDVFPNGLCVNCNWKILEKKPLSEIPMPDFKKTIKI